MEGWTTQKLLQTRGEHMCSERDETSTKQGYFRSI